MLKFLQIFLFFQLFSYAYANEYNRTQEISLPLCSVKTSFNDLSDLPAQKIFEYVNFPGTLSTCTRLNKQNHLRIQALLFPPLDDITRKNIDQTEHQLWNNLKILRRIIKEKISTDRSTYEKIRMGENSKTSLSNTRL